MVSGRARKEAFRLYRELTHLLYSDIPREYRIRYLILIRKISMKTRTRIPRYLKIFYCKKCKKIILPGVDAVYRVRSRPYKHIAVKCLSCGAIYRMGYKT
ncbi:MAG TPA: ribonuclease P [Thermoprotei archaeon]|nr:ribonuclease P [Thermoprotei archaeon]